MDPFFFLQVPLASGSITACLNTKSTKFLKTEAKCLLGNDQNLRFFVYLLLWLVLKEIILFVFTSHAFSVF